jgi:glycosyltransferase involved in cell wall biosynthesis
LLFGDSNIRGDRAAGIKRGVKDAILPRVLSWCSGVLYCGTLGREYFLRYGVPAERLFPFPYEPDYQQIWGLSTAQIDETGARFGLPSDRRFIVYSGRLAPEKRVDLLVDAFVAMADERPEWDMLIIGGGPLETELQSHVPAKLGGRVRWLGFVDDQSAVSALYRRSDVLVLPSDYEPWAVVINEAVAAGLAVIASDMVGAAADLVRDGVNGRIFRRGDVGDLTTCLREVTGPGKAERMGAASAEVLADFRKVADPIDGLRNAFRQSEIIWAGSQPHRT